MLSYLIKRKQSMIEWRGERVNKLLFMACTPLGHADMGGVIMNVLETPITLAKQFNALVHVACNYNCLVNTTSCNAPATYAFITVIILISPRFVLFPPRVSYPHCYHEPTRLWYLSRYARLVCL